MSSKTKLIFLTNQCLSINIFFKTFLRHFCHACVVSLLNFIAYDVNKILSDSYVHRKYYMEILYIIIVLILAFFTKSDSVAKK